MRPGVRRGLRKHRMGWVHILVQMGHTGSGWGKEEPEDGPSASALALWCWEAGGPR